MAAVSSHDRRISPPAVIAHTVNRLAAWSGAIHRSASFRGRAGCLVKTVLIWISAFGAARAQTEIRQRYDLREGYVVSLRSQVSPEA
jgi:hypothetical protein